MSDPTIPVGDNASPYVNMSDGGNNSSSPGGIFIDNNNAAAAATAHQDNEDDLYSMAPSISESVLTADGMLLCLLCPLLE